MICKLIEQFGVKEIKDERVVLSKRAIVAQFLESERNASYLTYVRCVGLKHHKICLVVVVVVVVVDHHVPRAYILHAAVPTVLYASGCLQTCSNYAFWPKT